MTPEVKKLKAAKKLRDKLIGATADDAVLLAVEKDADRIWYYVRDNKMSLSSEVCTRKIRESIVRAIKPFAELAHKAAVEFDDTYAGLRDKSKQLRKENKELLELLEEPPKKFSGLNENCEKCGEPLICPSCDDQTPIGVTHVTHPDGHE